MTEVQPHMRRVPNDSLAGDLSATAFDGWDGALKAEFIANAFNFRVGGTLLSENDHVKVWEIRLNPGERLPAHRHVLDYFWTVLQDGVSRQHIDDGATRIVRYHQGETRHFVFEPGEYLLHDLENIGKTPLVFVTVEHKHRSDQLDLQRVMAS